MLETLFAFFKFIVELGFEIFEVRNGRGLGLLLVSECFSNLVIDLVENL